MKLSKFLKKKLLFGDADSVKARNKLEMSEFKNASADTDLSHQVVLSLDILSKVFEQLSILRPCGFTSAEIARYGLVCRTWRRASSELPLVAEFKGPLQPYQQAALLSTEQKISALTFAEGDASAMEVLQHPDFCSKQGKHVKLLWKVDDIDSFGDPLSLLDYPNLQTLFFNCEPRTGCRLDPTPARAPRVQVLFDSQRIKHLHQLQVLSLRGYHTLDLLSLPLSLQVLYVGRANLVMRANQTSENLDPEFSSSFYEPDTAQSASQPGSSAFPSGLKLQKVATILVTDIVYCEDFRRSPGPSYVILNSQRGGWLGEPLSHYLAVAQQVTFYGRTLLVKSPPDEACRTLASHLTDSPVEQLDLEFDLISIIRIAPGGGETHEDYRWHRYEYSAADLAALLSAHLTDYYVHFSRGRLFQHSFTITRRPNM